MNTESPILQIKNVSKYYKVKKHAMGATHTITALKDVSLDIQKGETVAVIGESGCGKTTLTKQILGIENPDVGEIWCRNEPVHQFKQRPKRLIRQMQLVFQNPYSSLNPRQTIYSTLEAPLRIHTDMNADQRKKIIYELLERVGLHAEHAERYPHMFSGGQRQRIAIARAIILKPELLILDEPISALDLLVQAQVLNLLKDLQKEFSLTYLFITHDISIIRFIAEKLMVMYLGRSVEFGNTSDILTDPKHPYTKALLSAIPSVQHRSGSDRIKLQGEIPSPLNPPKGCPFHTRCPVKMPICETAFPSPHVTPGRTVFCYNYLTDNQSPA